MEINTPAEGLGAFTGVEARRSTRLEQLVPLIVTAQNSLGQSFQEQTTALSVNLHGCRYPSRHEYRIGTWVALQLAEQGRARAPIVRAQVRSIHGPRSPRELHQVGVELETPANIWGVSAPPQDWLRMLGVEVSAKQSAAAVAPALERPEQPGSSAQSTIALGPVQAGTPTAPLPPPTATSVATETPKDSGSVKPRVVITPEQLVAALQGKLQLAAEKAVQNALGTQIEVAVREALARIDEATRSYVRQMEELSAQRRESVSRLSREDVLEYLETHLREAERRWNEDRARDSARVTEMIERLEELAGETRRDIGETQKFLEKISRELEPQVRAQLEECVTRAREDIESGAARVCDRQLVRLMEDSQMMTREASAQVEARVAEARALVQSSASAALDEFRRQSEVQIDLGISEATQRVTSSLASLDADNRAACEARRRSLEENVARAAEQSAEQFRNGIKAFLYSCLVAAVSAVDQHAQSALEGLAKNPGKQLHEIAEPTETPGKAGNNT